MDYALTMLWSWVGKRALHYLRERRLTDTTIRHAQLGYIPGGYRDWRILKGLNAPCGIAIPWIINGDLWAIKVRRAAGLPKYIQIKGGSPNGLYNTDSLKGRSIALFTEGEFDALLAQRELGDLVSVVTLGSASNALDNRWIPLLTMCQVILLAYDTDNAGNKGADRFQALTHRARPVSVPHGKDITEFVLQGGNVREWIQGCL